MNIAKTFFVGSLGVVSLVTLDVTVITAAYLYSARNIAPGLPPEEAIAYEIQDLGCARMRHPYFTEFGSAGGLARSAQEGSFSLCGPRRTGFGRGDHRLTSGEFLAEHFAPGC